MNFYKSYPSYLVTDLELGCLQRPGSGKEEFMICDEDLVCNLTPDKQHTAVVSAATRHDMFPYEMVS